MKKVRKKVRLRTVVSQGLRFDSLKIEKKKVLKIRSQLHHLCVLKSQVRIQAKSSFTFK